MSTQCSLTAHREYVTLRDAALKLRSVAAQQFNRRAGGDASTTADPGRGDRRCAA